MRRHAVLAASAATLLIVSLVILVTPLTARASTTCRAYFGYPDPFSFGLNPRSGRLCMAPADDFPGYRGWDGRIAPVCGRPAYFPPDFGEPASDGGVTCMALPTSLRGYRYETGRWTSIVDPNPPSTETELYIYPFTGGWRWVWTRQSGWFAVQSRSLVILWFTPADVGTIDEWLAVDVDVV